MRTIIISPKLIGLVLLAGLVVGWILALAGVARAEDLCVKSISASTSSGSGSGSSSGSSGLSAADAAALAAALAAAGRRRLLTADSDALDLASGASVAAMRSGRRLRLSAVDTCGMQLSLWWWTIFFELVCIALAAMLLFNLPGSVRSFRQVANTFFTIATVLLCLQAFAFVPATQAGAGAYYTAASVVSAGTIILLVCNFLWIIVNQSHFGDPQVHSLTGSEEAIPK